MKEPEFILEHEFDIADEKNYKELVPAAVKSGKKLVLRTPIDINLAKELNILAMELGLKQSQILVDTDIGGLGYGLEYGYSMIEKVKLSDDKYLQSPVISFVVEETLKTKEAKTDARYALFAEITAATAVAAAGADIVVMHSQEAKDAMERVWQN